MGPGTRPPHAGRRPASVVQRGHLHGRSSAEAVLTRRVEAIVGRGRARRGLQRGVVMRGRLRAGLRVYRARTEVEW